MIYVLVVTRKKLLSVEDCWNITICHRQDLRFFSISKSLCQRNSRVLAILQLTAKCLCLAFVDLLHIMYTSLFTFPMFWLQWWYYVVVWIVDKKIKSIWAADVDIIAFGLAVINNNDWRCLRKVSFVSTFLISSIDIYAALRCLLNPHWCLWHLRNAR